MEINESTIQGLRIKLIETLSPNEEIRKSAELFLNSLDNQQHYSILLLKVLEIPALDAESIASRQACAVLFKNYIKKNWDDDEENKVSYIVDHDRTIIKEHIISLMCNMPEVIQIQLGTALSTIAEYDFPDKWPKLLPELCYRLSFSENNKTLPDDIESWRVRNGILLTANTIFKRFRNTYKTDELYTVLKYCLDTFCPTMLTYYQYVSNRLKETSRNSNENKEKIIMMIQALRTLNRIYYSLNWQDLPEFMEDNLQYFMSEFQFYLQYINPELTNNHNSCGEPDILDLLYTSIIEIINLYAEKYSDEFNPYLPSFTSIIWSLLSSQLTLLPKHDFIVAASLKFLRVIAAQPENVNLFLNNGNNNVLAEICENIIINNMRLREIDEELFEDNPMDFIRRDIEEQDSDSRRGSAKELLKSFITITFNNTHVYRKIVTEIFLENISKLLIQYQQDPIKNWQIKDVVINIFIGITVVKKSRALGVTEISQYSPLSDFLKTQVLTELSGNGESNPILKSDAIKFVALFRNQLSFNDIVTIIPLLVKTISPENFVVHTYAASCVEKLFSIKDSNNNKQELLVRPHLNKLLSALFTILEQPNYPENDYIIKAVMRLINVSECNYVQSVSELCLVKLISILNRIYKNVSNPRFLHYLFETIAVLISKVCQDGGRILNLEKFLFAPFMEILQQDVATTAPYIYQIFAELMELSLKNQVSTSFSNLFPVLLTPSLWEKPSNVTALVKLLEAYLKKLPEPASNNITGVLGIYQKLISSKITESQSLSLIRSVITFIPLNVYESFVMEIFKIMMMRLQIRMKAKNSFLFVKDIICTISLFISKYDAKKTFQYFDGLQAGMSQMLLDQIIIPNLAKSHITNVMEKKVLVVGLVKILTEMEPQNNEINSKQWIKILEATMKTLSDDTNSQTSEVTSGIKNQEELLEDLEESGYEAGYSKLFYANISPIDYLPDVPINNNLTFKRFLVQNLVAISQRRPTYYPKLCQSLMEASYQSELALLFQQSNAVFS